MPASASAPSSVRPAPAAGHRWSPFEHFTLAAAIGAVVLLSIARWVPVGAQARSATSEPAGGATPARRVVLWLLAVIALCSAIAEGATGDWSALLLISERGMSESSAALVYSGFSVSMAIARLGGAWFQQRFGPTRTLTAGAVCAGSH